jgi:hypothetical protein
MELSYRAEIRPADGRDLEIDRLEAKVGELTMTDELLDAKDRSPGDTPPFGTAEDEAMRGEVSHSTNLRYGATMMSRLWLQPPLSQAKAFSC